MVVDDGWLFLDGIHHARLTVGLRTLPHTRRHEPAAVGTHAASSGRRPDDGSLVQRHQRRGVVPGWRMDRTPQHRLGFH